MAARGMVAIKALHPLHRYTDEQLRRVRYVWMCLDRGVLIWLEPPDGAS